MMRQHWLDVLFLHWPLEPDELRPSLPLPLRPYLDVFEGKAWLTITPLRMRGVRLRGTPAIPGLSAFPELNFRTYLTRDAMPGVFFFTLDAANYPAVLAARWGFSLPYVYSKMQATSTGSEVTYTCRRISSPRPAEFSARYGPASSTTFYAAPGTLDHFLVERYCLYTVSGSKALRCHIHHKPWPLQQATYRLTTNSIAEAVGLRCDSSNIIAHYAAFLDVMAWLPGKVA